MRAHFAAPQPRRRLLIAAAAVALVLGGATAALVLSLDSASAHGRDLSTARFPGFNLSFRYPAVWQRRDWCWTGTNLSPVTLLTTSDPAPQCTTNAAFGGGTPFPPPQSLASDGIAAWWFSTDRRALLGVSPNAHVGGEPARITVRREPAHRATVSLVTCVGSGATQRFLSAQIQGPNSNVPQLRLDAVICGPDFASGEADVRQMLESVRLTR